MLSKQTNKLYSTKMNNEMGHIAAPDPIQGQQQRNHTFSTFATNNTVSSKLRK